MMACKVPLLHVIEVLPTFVGVWRERGRKGRKERGRERGEKGERRGEEEEKGRGGKGGCTVGGLVPEARASGVKALKQQGVRISTR